ncbi:MAG: hypothetical protein HY648_00565 [Acidobacteria bacterium]|nr:hypothetical protein [Acidobacteriota bacterium]
MLTGFEPFGRWKVNPSEQVVRALAEQAQLRGDESLVTAILPTEYARGGKRLLHLIRTIRPEAVLCLGVAPARRALSLERVALNLDDDPLADNAGQVRSGRSIVPGGPAAYWSTLPLAQMRRSLEKRGIPAVISNHAGAYLCNHAFYLARHEMESGGNPCGFVHLPGSYRWKGRPSRLPLRKLLEAVQCCLDILRRSGRSGRGRLFQHR